MSALPVRRLLGAAVLTATALGVASRVGADPPGSADITITVESTVGPVEFRTLYLPVGAFALDDGQSRRFKNLDPGRYVVVQAPPIGTSLRFQCSDGGSGGDIILDGTDVSCTFYVD